MLILAEMERWPAEWEPQACCLVGYPDHLTEWDDQLDAARDAAIKLCHALGRQAVLCVSTSATEPLAQRIDGTVRRLIAGDVWLRDTGPVWLRSATQPVAVSFRWTGWGGRYLLDGDDEVGQKLADGLGVPLRTSALATEGGALETDGAGTCLTTRVCIINDNRNPGLTESQAETELKEHLRVDRVIWIDKGLVGDHTDGHIDNLARFTSPGVVAVAASASDDPNHAVHNDVRRTIEAAGLEPRAVPSPGLVTDARGEVVPASYLNFVVANGVVCVPTFARDSDDNALAAIDALFPTRRVVGVDARALLYGGGALHCMTNNLPAFQSPSPSPPPSGHH